MRGAKHIAGTDHMIALLKRQRHTGRHDGRHSRAVCNAPFRASIAARRSSNVRTVGLVKREYMLPGISPEKACSRFFRR